MGGGRQAWCPRCDDVRAAKPGASCPVCGRELLAVPATRPGQPPPGRADRAARRLRALRPAAAAAGVGLLVLAVVASAFAAGRLTRTTPSTPASATATTGPGEATDGPETGRRDFAGWQAQDGGITVTLRSLTVGTGFSRMELHVDGVQRGREVSTLEGLRVRDASGNDLLAGGEQPRIATSSSRPGAGRGIDAEVVLGRPLDLEAVAAVELGGVTVGRTIQDRLAGSLHDPELQRRADDNLDDFQWTAGRRSCPGCELRVACEDCPTLRVVGSAYRRGRILVTVEAVGRVERTTLNPSRRRVVVSGEGGVSDLPAWMDGAGGTAVISIAADELAISRFGDGDEPMPFGVIIRAQAEQVVRGTWVIRQAGG
jgi:Heavy metal binding domain